jgi:hypothetical protein
MGIALASITAATLSSVVLQSTIPRTCDNVCIQEHIDNCDKFEFRKQRAFGGSTVNMIGIQSDGNCGINIHVNAEKDLWMYSWSVPMDKLREWRNWDSTNGLDSSHISSYCIDA